MEGLSITEFRRRGLSLLEDLPDEGITITKRGRAVARIVPVPPPGKGRRARPPFIKGGHPGPLCPNLKTPWDLVFD